MKMAVFWDVAPYSLVEIERQGNRPDDGGSKHLWNVGYYYERAINVLADLPALPYCSLFVVYLWQ
jgi:hypothetical protein